MGENTLVVEREVSLISVEPHVDALDGTLHTYELAGFI
jgi:hypothetical protein